MAIMTTSQMLTGIKNWVLGKIANITALIPLQASTSNQLADKAFVSSSVATATATFRGTYNVVTDLSLAYNATHSQIESALATKMTALSITPDNNDYAFVQIPTADATPTEIARIEKYKYNGSAWAFEYELNNSGFTAAQWAAINSGATLELMGKLSALPTNSELATLLNGKAAKAQNPTSGHLAALDSNGSLTDSGISIDDNGAYDVTAHNSGATFASLSALLSDANLSTLIPADVRKGGMSIKFVQSSDNKYVQYRFMHTLDNASTASADFANTANWQGVDDVPTPGRENLISSRGIQEILKNSLDENVSVRMPTIGEPYDRRTNVQGYYSAIIPVLEGDVFQVSGAGGSNTRLWGTLDKDGIVLRRSDAGSYKYEVQTVTIQSGEYYFVYNTNSSSDPGLTRSSFRHTKISNSISLLLKRINAIIANGYRYIGIAEPTTEPDITLNNVFYIALNAGTYTNFDSSIINNNGITALLWNGTSWTTQTWFDSDINFPFVTDLAINFKNGIGEKPLYITDAIGYIAAQIPVVAGQTFILSGHGGTNTRLWGTLDKDGRLVRMSDIGDMNATVIIENNECFLVYNSLASYTPNIFKQNNGVAEYVVKILCELSNITYNSFNKIADFDHKINFIEETALDLRKEFPYQTSTTQSTSHWKSVLIKTQYVGQIYTFNDCRSGNLNESTGHANLPSWFTLDDNGNLVRCSSQTSTFESGTVIIQEGEKYVAFNALMSTTTASVICDCFVKCLEKPVIYDIDNAVISSVKYIYGVKTGETTREYAIRLYAEGLLRTGMPISFVDGLTMCLQGYDTNNSQKQTDIVIPMSMNYSFHNKTVRYVESSVSSLSNKNINILIIGDSNLARRRKNLVGEYNGPWNYASWLKWFSMMDNVNFGNINLNMVGTMNNYDQSIQYKGNTYIIRACSEGVGGRTAYCYLNSPIAFKMGTAYETTVRLNSETAWYAFGLATKTPFDSTVTGHSFTEFTNTDENKILLASTPFGRFKPDLGSNSTEYAKVAILWNKLKEFDDFSGTGDYTGSIEQKTLITNWFDSKMDNPDNPFYDKNKARAYTGNHVWTNNSAFNLDTYLVRYRTMNDNGERLNISDTSIGTYITENNIEKIDVCTPTHIIISLGGNDVDASLDVAKLSIDTLISEIQNWSNSIKIIYGLMRYAGVWWNRYQNTFTNVVKLNRFQNIFDLNEYYIGLYGQNFNKNNQVHFCPTYNVQSVLGNDNCIANIDLETETLVIGNSYDTIHGSIIANKTVGYQFYSLLAALL